MVFSATRLSRNIPFRHSPFRKITLLFTASSQLFFQLLCATPVLAGPAGGNVVGGQGSINQQGLNTTINQASNRLAIDWQRFNVAENESVQFIQPGRDSVALNRIFDQNPSQILGRIDANGSIVLVNPRGVLFGNSATVNVGGLVASALDIKTHDFMNGDFLFSVVEDSDGVVVNRGLLNAATGGSITLLGKRVSNEGLISARLGKVNLAAGAEAVLTFDPAGFIGVEVTKAVLENELGIDSAVLNEGTIRADGGQVLMTAKVSKDLFSNAVNNKGIVQAGSIEKRHGAIFLNGLGGDVVNSGRLDASATDAGANGGDVTLSGDNVTHSGIIRADAAQGDVGTIAIDSRGTTLLTENSETSASAIAAGKGGTITVLGQHVGLFDQSLIAATGFNGGGEVLFGGDEQGLNPDISNADAIYIGENTTINVNATTEGDGGKLIAYADLSAKVYGVLTARGGSQGGNGGFIETSGKQFIDIGVAPDAGAVSGDGGLWLIDPYDVTISNNLSSPSFTNPFVPSAINSNINVGVLTDALDNDGSVVIRTSPAGVDTGEFGDISIDDPINYSGGASTLTLIAERNINVNKNIISSGGQLSLNLTASESAVGATTIANGVSLQTRGGNVVFKGGVNVVAGASITTGIGSVTTNNGNNSGDVIIGGTIDTDSTFNVNNTTGNVQILNGARVTADGGIIVTGSTDTTTSFEVGDGDGSAAINTNNNNITFSDTDTIQFLNGSTINTNGGDLTVTNGTAFTIGDASAGASVNTNNGDVVIASGVNVSAGSSITTGSGSITTNNGSNPGNVIISGTIDTDNTFNVNNTTGNVQILNGGSVTADGGIIVTGTTDTTTSFQVGDGDGSASISTNNNNITFRDTDTIQFLNGSTVNTNGGDLTVINGTAFTVGSAAAGAAINTNGGDVTVGVSGAVNMAGSTANAATITTVGGAVDITAASVGNNVAGNMIDSTGASSGNGGDVSITTDSGLSVGSIVAKGGAASEENGLQGGAITLTALNGNTITATGTLDASGGDGQRRSGNNSNRSRSGGAGGVIQLITNGEVSIAAVELSGGNADGINSQNSRNGGAAGSIVFGDTAAIPNPISPSKITLSGNITAVGGDPFRNGDQGNGSSINFNAPVIELGNPGNAQNLITIDTRGNSDGSMTFGGTVDTQASAPAPVNLTLESGTADITMLGAVGTSAGQQRLGAVNFNTEGDVKFSSGLTFEANSLTATAINNFTTINAIDTGVSIITTGLADTNGGAIRIGDASTVAIKLGDLTTTGGADVDLTGGNNAGLISLRANNLTVGAVSATGSDSVAANGNGGQGGSITLTADAQLLGINGAINNSGGVATGTGAGGAGAGITIALPNTTDFTFANDFISKGGAAQSGIAGAGGSISVTANNLAAGNTLAMSGDVDASGGDASAAGAGGTAGTISLTSNRNLASAGNLTAAGGNTAAGGAAGTGNDVTLNAGGNDVITLTGTLRSAGGTDGTVVAAGGDITIEDDARVNDSVTLDTGAGSGDINFRGTLVKGTGNGDINATAGSGDIQFSGNVGASNNRVGTITLSSANNVTSNNPIFATAINQIAGTGKTNFQSTINTNNVAGISLTGNEFDLRTVTTNGGVFIVEADGLIDFRSGVVTTAGGDVDLTSHGASLDLSQSITTSGGDLLVNLDNTNAANNALTISSTMNTGTGDFEATKTGALTITSSGSITTNGDASEVRIVDSGAVDINGGITTGGGKITVTNSGAITVNEQVSTASGTIDIANSGAFVITNNGVVNTAGGDFTLLNSDSFDGQNGRITTAQGNVVINSRGVIQLGKIETTSSDVAAEGSLSVTSTGGIITQSSNTAQNLAVQGNAVFTANDAAALPAFFNITLNNTNNQFGGNLDGSVSFNGKDVSLRASSATINLGASTVNGTLDVGQINAIKQSGALVVSGTATFTAGGNAITLNDTTNNFQAGVVLSNSGDNDVQINNAGNLLIGSGGWNLGSGNLSVSANGIEQNGSSGAILQATDAAGAQLTSGSGPILLNNTSNNFNGVVELNGSSAQASILRDANDLELGASTLGGDLTVNAGNNLTVSETITLAEQLPEGFGNSALTLNFGLNGNGSQLNLQAASFVASNLVVNGNAGAAVDTLLMNNGDYEWVIDGANQGYIVDLGATVRDKNIPSIPRETPALAFSNVEKINGGTGDDTFRLVNGGTISAGIDAGAGDDLIDLRDEVGPITLRIGQDISNGVQDIEGAIGNGENSTLIANNVANTWTIDGANEGRLDEDNSDLEFTFENFYHLRGGDNKDAFVFLDGGSIAGSIDAGANQNTALNTLDLSNLAGNYDWNVTNSNAGNVQINGGNTLINSFSAVDELLGSAGRDVFTLGPGVQLTRINGNGSDDRINGADRNTSWVINEENAGDVIDNEANGGPAKIYEFVAIENIVGGTGEDIFDVSDVNAKIGNVNGGGGAARNTLVAGNANNTWQIDADDNNQLINATTNTQTAGFTAVENLSGGSAGDTFVLADQAVVVGTIDGGIGENHLDMSAYSSDVLVDLQNASVTAVNGGGDNGISNIAEFSAGSGSDTFSAQSTLNDWIVDNINAGNINDNAFVFNGFENLQGSGNVDNFVVTTTGSVDGTIRGGANDDTLQLNYATTNRTLVFDGEEGANDVVTLQGDTNGGRSTYTHDINQPNAVVNTATGAAAVNTQTVTLQNVEQVTDTMTANEISLVGTLADDDIQLGGNGTNNQMAVAGFTPIVFSNKTNVSLNGGGASDRVVALGVSPVTANRLTIDGVTTIGETAQAIQTDIAELQIVNATGDVYINEANDLDLLDSVIGGGFNISALAGDIIASGALNVTGNAVFTAGNGAAITLANTANRFSSPITFATNNGGETLGEVILFNNLAVDLQGLTSSGLSVTTSGGDITGVGALLVRGLSQFDAASGDVLLINDGNDFDVLRVSNTGTLDVRDIDDLGVDSVTASTVSLAVGGAINDANGTAVNVTAASVALVANQGIGHSDGLETAVGSLAVNNADSGNINIANSGSLTVTEATNTGTASGNINITANGDFTLTGDASSSGAVEFSAQNQLQQQADIGAVNSVSLSAADVTQRGNINVSDTAASVNVSSSNGNITMVDGFATETTGGNISYIANGNVTVSTLNAIYGGGDVRISSATGSILAARDPVRTLPNVSANNATFVAPTGSLGTPERPLVINARNIFIQTLTSAPPVFTTRPDRIEDLSRVLLGVNEAKAEVGGNQRTEVDSLAVIDPAIFTQVKNYREDDNAVKLPDDQLYNEDDDDDDRNKVDPDIFESEQPYEADSASVKDKADQEQAPVTETN